MDRMKFSRVCAEGQAATEKCAGCGNALPKPAHTLCSECLQKKAARSKELYYERKANGLCVKCGKPAVPGKVKCAECAKPQW